jgi:hypothetical protein
MIIVFVIDTSPSMSRPVFASSSSPTADGSTGGSRSLTRLDLAKMAVEDICRQLRKGLALNLNYPADPAMARSLSNIGQGGAYVASQDSLLLLSTSRQYPDTASCAAGGRLLVGFGTDDLPIEVGCCSGLHFANTCSLSLTFIYHTITIGFATASTAASTR